MDKFINNIENICKNHNNVAMFIDMDGTIAEYPVLLEDFAKLKGIFLNANPIDIVINKLRKINMTNNLDLYILSLARSSIIVDEKKIWLNKYAKFIKPENWIILNREAGDYNNENRDYIKALKMKEKLKDYDATIFLDDDHKMLKEAKKLLKEKVYVYHISSALI